MAYSSTNGANDNPVAEGNFVDYSTVAETTRLLQFTGKGFDATQFDAAHPTYVRSATTAGEVDTELALIDTNGGGTLDIAAGTYTFSSSPQAVSNVLIQGAGADTTELVFSGSTDFFKFKHHKNIVIRDLTINGDGECLIALLFWYCENVLIERCKVKLATKSGIYFRHASKLTVRYCESFSNDSHGFGCKDYEGSAATLAAADAEYDSEATTLDGGEPLNGSLWTNDASVYSNKFYDSVNENGIDYHADDCQFAGNWCNNNAAGNKWPDAQDVYIYRNHFGAGDYGVRVYNAYDIAEHLARNVYAYDNQLVGNDEAIRVAGDAHLFADGNVFTSNSTDLAQGTSGGTPTIATCSGSVEESLGFVFNSTKCAEVNALRSGQQAPSSNTFEVRTANDAEEQGNGTVRTTSGDLDIGESDYIGIHFANVLVANQAEVSAAHVRFTSKTNTSGGLSVAVYADDSDSSSAFVVQANDISDRTPTTAQVSWSPDSWTSGNTYDTPDLSTVIQEIVNRPGWASGNDLSIIINGLGNKRVANSHDLDSASAPLLHVEYGVGSTILSSVESVGLTLAIMSGSTETVLESQIESIGLAVAEMGTPTLITTKTSQIESIGLTVTEFGSSDLEIVKELTIRIIGLCIISLSSITVTAVVEKVAPVGVGAGVQY